LIFPKFNAIIVSAIIISKFKINICRYLDKLIEIEDYLQSKLSVPYEGRQITYSDFCENNCETSDVVSIFLNMYREVHIRKKGNVKLTYPSMDVFGNRIYLANNIFQVELNNRIGNI
uniref:DUF3825 domain-containing protein n=1 Tax=Onchocerca flexuosa TaxID=387005 RepID=A0A183HPV7_9BILA